MQEKFVDDDRLTQEAGLKRILSCCRILLQNVVKTLKYTMKFRLLLEIPLCPRCTAKDRNANLVCYSVCWVEGFEFIFGLPRGRIS